MPTRSACARSASRARRSPAPRAGNTLTGEQLTGGTFTISNLGMYGTQQFDAILNLPEVGILAVGAAEKRPVVEGDQLVVGTVMTVTLTADHRAVDGAMAAEFLQTLKGLLEEPASMLLVESASRRIRGADRRGHAERNTWLTTTTSW